MKTVSEARSVYVWKKTAFEILAFGISQRIITAKLRHLSKHQPHIFFEEKRKTRVI